LLKHAGLSFLQAVHPEVQQEVFAELQQAGLTGEYLSQHSIAHTYTSAMQQPTADIHSRNSRCDMLVVCQSHVVGRRQTFQHYYNIVQKEVEES
jgi:hypothetical protein